MSVFCFFVFSAVLSMYKVSVLNAFCMVSSAHGFLVYLIDLLSAEKLASSCRLLCVCVKGPVWHISVFLGV